MSRGKAQCSALLVLGVVFCAPCAKAIVNISINQYSYGVRIEGSGSLDLSALTLSTSSYGRGYLNPSSGMVTLGNGNGYPSAPVTFTNGDAYSGATLAGPTSFGNIFGFTYSNSGGGDLIGIRGPGNCCDPTYVIVPSSYVFGSALSGYSVYDGKTLASLGLTSGTYSWTWGSGVNDDSLTVNIASVAAVPGPLPILGLPAVLFYSRKLKKRIKARRESSGQEMV
jgi:hypothetical protein